jgi:hypothetical protein
VSRRPLLGACGVAALCVAAAVALLAGGRVGSTWASFNNLFWGETENAGSSYGASWLGAPTLAAPSVSGNNATLSWTVSNHGPGSANGQGQEVLGSFTASNGTSTTCPTTGYTQIAVPSGTATSYTDSGRGAGFGGEYYCYEVASTYATNWVTASAAQRVQFPFYATSLSLSNGNNTLASGDKVTISFNNTPQGFAASGSLTVITCTTTRVLLGASSCSSTPSVGTLTVSGKSVVSSRTFSSSYTFSANTIVVTLGGSSSVTLGGGGSPTWTFTPTSTLKQGGNVAICTASASGCLPTTTSSF